jgi:hypothetical protein
VNPELYKETHVMEYFSAEIEKGANVLAEIETRLSELAQSEVNFSRLRIRLGMLLKEVQDHQYWKESYESFGEYVASLEDKYHRSRTQCYSYLRLVTDLLPVVGEDKLAEMSVSKAQLLSQSKKITGALPAAEILNMAADSGVSTKDFRQVLLDNKKLPDVPQDGRYRSIDCFFTGDQWKTYLMAVAHVKQAEQLTGSDEVQNGKIQEIFSQEYLNTNVVAEKEEF